MGELFIYYHSIRKYNHRRDIHIGKKTITIFTDIMGEMKSNINEVTTEVAHALTTVS